MSPNGTWNTELLKGYWFYGFEWISLVCRVPDRTTKTWAQTCLSNSTVFVFGDSNSDIMYDVLLSITECTNVIGRWHRNSVSVCARPELGLTLRFISHESPRFVSLSREDYSGSVARHLDRLPSTGRYIVIVHYYLHYVTSHLSVLYLRMKAIREASERLVKRNPQALIGVRGPHIVTKDWDINHSYGGDSLGPKYLEIILDVFKGLENQVVFLDGWGMTISTENANFHPPHFVSRGMIKLLLSFQCRENGTVVA